VRQTRSTEPDRSRKINAGAKRDALALRSGLVRRGRACGPPYRMTDCARKDEAFDVLLHPRVRARMRRHQPCTARSTSWPPRAAVSGARARFRRHARRPPRRDRAPARATIALAHDLGFETVAEGVEDRESWEILVALGCDVAQGYHIAQPMPAVDVAGWLEAGRPGSGSSAGRRSAERCSAIRGGARRVRQAPGACGRRPAIVELICDILAKHEFHVVTAANGSEVLRLVDETAPGTPPDRMTPLSSAPVRLPGARRRLGFTRRNLTSRRWRDNAWVRPSMRQPLPTPLSWLALASAPQILITLAIAPPGVWTQVAGMSAVITVAAVLTLGILARSWTDSVLRLLASRTVWFGLCVAAALDGYVCARQILALERLVAIGVALLVALALARRRPTRSRSR